MKDSLIVRKYFNNSLKIIKPIKAAKGNLENSNLLVAIRSLIYLLTK